MDPVYMKEHYDAVDEWFKLYSKRVLARLGLESNAITRNTLRIAVLDGCIDRGRSIIQRMGERLKDVKKFYVKQEDDPTTEFNPHSAHLVSILHRMAPFADIYLGEIAGPSGKFDDSVITEALYHAVTKPHGWQANIVVMAFCTDPIYAPHLFPQLCRTLETRSTQIDPVTIFAPSGQRGGNFARSYPAGSASVFAIHATDYFGDPPEPNFNASAIRELMNYSTIGWLVLGDGDTDDSRITGASIAAAVAAGIAAAVIEFSRKNQLEPNLLQHLHTYDGMGKIFRKIAVRRGDYDYLDWAGLFHPYWFDRTILHTIQLTLLQQV